VPGDAETEEVEKGNTQCDDDARPQHGGIVNHLVPTTGKIEEGRTGSPGGQDRHEDDDCSCTKEAFETDSIERSDRILFHDLFLNDELGSGANDEGYKRREKTLTVTRELLTRAERTRRRRYLLQFRRVS